MAVSRTLPKKCPRCRSEQGYLVAAVGKAHIKGEQITYDPASLHVDVFDKKFGPKCVSCNQLVLWDE